MQPLEYFPILKSKQGELRALRESKHLPATSPILEIVPWERDEGDWENDDVQLQKSVERVTKAWNGSQPVLFIDAAAAERDPVDGWGDASCPSVLATMVDRLSRAEIPVAPVIRAASRPDYLTVVRANFDALGISPERAVVRVTAEDLDETVAPLRDVAQNAVARLGIAVEDTDLLLDFGSVSDETVVAMSTRLARLVLPQFEGQGWRSLVLGAGAFPANLSEVTAGTVVNLPRQEVSLWRSASSFLSTPLSFADYAVTHPILPQGAPFAAPPQLRYSIDGSWLVAKGRRNDRRGHQQFFDICAQVLKAAGAESVGNLDSWGDQYIKDAAHESTTPAGHVGPGNASTWRAIATSRHLALVSNRLSERGEP